MHRVLKSTGSLYLHCDPTASHYLKIVLDGVFGKENFRNEIIWKRANAHNDPKRFGRISDAIFYYSKTDNCVWNHQYTPYREDYYESHFKKDEQERWYRTVPLDAPRHGDGSPGLLYDWKGKMPAQTRTWAVKRESMEQYEKDGRLRYTKTGTPTLLQYADEMPGVPLQNMWTDLPPVNPQAAERLGYPTQKPLALLERIILASSDEGQVILDPFCGCGTAVHAAEKLRRNWIGIDITHLAITLIEKRLRDAFSDIDFEVHGTPKDVEGARNLALRDKYQFQWWACSLVAAAPYQGKKKGADSGIDGVIYFQDEEGGSAKKIVVSVKGGEHISVPMIRDLGHVVQRENAAIGLLVSLSEPTKPMVVEATKAGYYESPQTKRNFPRLQILTVEQLLEGKARPAYPNIESGGVTFKKAKAESKQDQGKLF
jgi:DNA modification methylase